MSEPSGQPVRETLMDHFRLVGQRPTAFDPTASPLKGRLAFVVGAPRSGTTWLQQMLLVHPEVVTGGESHLFCEVLPPAYEAFANPDPTSDLSTWVTAAELDGAVRAFCDTLLGAALANRPSARVVVEKTPDHRLQAALQARLYPDAAYVHLIRDGRDAAGSANALWGRRSREFSDPGEVAARWRDAVLDIRLHLGGLRYLEVRYEDLVTDPAGRLKDVLDHLGLVANAELRQEMAAFGRAPVNVAPTAGAVGERARNDVVTREVARVAGPLLVELGYARGEDLRPLQATRSTTTVAFDVRRAGRRAVRSVGSAGTRVSRAKQAWWVRRRDRTRWVCNRLVEAVANGEEASIEARLGPRVELAGMPRTGTPAHDLLVSLRGLDVSRIEAEPGAALVTFTGPDDERVVVQVRTGRKRVRSVRRA